MENQLLQIGGILGIPAALFALAIREYFAWQKTRKSPNGEEVNIKLAVIQEKLDNHIQHFCSALDKNCQDVEAIKKDINAIQIALVQINAKMSK